MKSWVRTGIGKSPVGAEQKVKYYSDCFLFLFRPFRAYSCRFYNPGFHPGVCSHALSELAEINYGTAEPFQVSPSEAVVYSNAIIGTDFMRHRVRHEEHEGLQ